MTKREAFVTMMNVLAETFNRSLTEGTLEGYWMAMSDLSESEMSAAAGRAVREIKFMPAPSELRSFVREARDLAAEAEIAWDAVRSAIDEIDWTVSEINFGPVVNACVRQLGGWDALLTAKLSELNVWKKKEFLRVYELFASKPVGDVGRPLEGPEDGRPYPPRIVAITGIPSQPVLELEPPGAEESRKAIRDTIKSLADGAAR